MESSTLADCSWARGTSCGTIPCIAGNEAADDVPLTASITIRCQSSACPVMTSQAASACETTEMTLAARITAPPPEPVGEDSAEQQEEHHRDAAGGEHLAKR